MAYWRVPPTSSTLRAVKTFAVLALVLSLCACVSGRARSMVVQQASFDHRCPHDDIVVLEENTDIWTYRLNVCGQEKMYRDRGGDKTFQFVDVTTDRTAAPPE